MSLKRLQKEYAKILNAKKDELPDNISVGPIDGNLYEWIGTIIGVKDTIYEGGYFKITISFPQNYPFVAPTIKFVTPIFHPNIHDNGEICLDILKYKWNPAYSIPQIMLSIIALLEEPNPEDPLNSVAAKIYKTNRTCYNNTVKEYIVRYCN